MAEKVKEQEKILLVSSSPHLIEPATSKRLMYEVVFGCLPAVAAALVFFRGSAGIVLISCLAASVGTEWLFNVVRKKSQTVFDGSVIITALILGLSLPPTIPFWAAGLGAVVAVGVAKMLFGGLGSNIFNPAMVGRAFLMACFGMMMTTWTAPTELPGFAKEVEVAEVAEVAAVTQPTPLALAKQPIKDAANPDKPAAQKATAFVVNQQLGDMFIGKISGSAGET